MCFESFKDYSNKPHSNFWLLICIYYNKIDASPVVFRNHKYKDIMLTIFVIIRDFAWSNLLCWENYGSLNDFSNEHYCPNTIYRIMIQNSYLSLLSQQLILWQSQQLYKGMHILPKHMCFETHTNIFQKNIHSTRTLIKLNNNRCVTKSNLTCVRRTSLRGFFFLPTEWTIALWERHYRYTCLKCKL